AVVNAREPEEVVADLGYDPAEVSLADVPYDDLVGLLESTIPTGVGRRLEREQRFYEDRLVFEAAASWDALCASERAPSGCTAPPRDHANVLALVEERVIVPDVIASYDLVPSLLDPDGFTRRLEEGFAAGRFPDVDIDSVHIEWRNWFNPRFLRTPASSIPEIAGIRTAILGSAWLVLITIGFAVPVGVGAAIYLVEYAKPSRLNDFIQTNIYNLAGVPSIVYGMLGLAILVRALEPVTSGAIFTTGPPPSVTWGATSTPGPPPCASGSTILPPALTLGFLPLPVVTISAQEALTAVPTSLRNAALGLGATRWQMVRSHVLPVAMPGILTGSILAVARAIGETAPLILVGAASFITVDPTGPFSKFTALPIQIFQWTSYPQEEFRNIAAAASLALLILLLLLNAGAVILRNRYIRKARW